MLLVCDMYDIFFIFYINLIEEKMVDILIVGIFIKELKLLINVVFYINLKVIRKL